MNYWGLVYLLNFFFFGVLSYQFPVSELNALQALYNSTNGENWRWTLPYKYFGYPWNFSSPEPNPCSQNKKWQGLSCSSSCATSQCNIISIDLDGHQLIGTLPPLIGNFSLLQNLSLSNNRLRGPIPDSISNLLNLKNLVFQENKLQGTIPSSFYNLKYLEILNFAFNKLTGTLPPSIGKLANLTNLIFLNNRLSGTLPESFGNLTNLKVLHVGYNSISGTIPEAICFLSNLEKIFLNNNIMTGTLPDNFGRLLNLNNIHMAFNFYTGTLPHSIGDLINLTEIYLNDNRLSGIIPASIGNLTLLEKLYFFHNRLTGPIPPSIGNLSNMNILYINNNHLTGAIPPTIKNFGQIVNLAFSGNDLTGSIPSEFGYLKTIEVLYLQNNFLSGTIPSFLSEMEAVSVLYLYYNILTGNFPDSFGRLGNLSALNIFRNYLSGPLPNTIGNATRLKYLNLQINLLSGYLPETMKKLTLLETLDIFNNFISGTVPSFISNWIQISQLAFANNKFTGTLPSGLSNLIDLKYLDVSNNSITGPLPSDSNMTLVSLQFLNLANNYMNGTLPSHIYLPKIKFLYLLNNSFSGTIPSNLVSNGALVALVTSVNCFTGTIPESICVNKNLSQIVLDGLHSSSSCSKNIIPFLKSSGFSTEKGVGGTIPSCLFEMESLKALHLSGNKLRGTISPNIPSFPKINSLALANNMLSGTIPDSIWKGELFFLDLSFNLLTSTVKDIYNEIVIGNVTIDSDPFELRNNTKNQNFTLKLQVNRLSGNVPSQYHTAQEINILEGNLFGCNLDRSDLPDEDPDNLSYQCGSDYTNTSIYIWMAIIATSIILVISFNARSTKNLHVSFLYYKDLITKWYCTFEALPLDDSYHNSNFSSFVKLQKSLELIANMTLFILLWILLFITPLYIGLTKFFGTHTHQYAWIFSSAYLEGVVPSIFLSIFYIILIFFIIFVLKVVDKEVGGLWSKVHIEALHWDYHRLKALFIIFLNVFIVLLVNISYILATNHGYSNSTMILISLGLSLFKLLWSNVVLLGSGRVMIENFLKVRLNPMTVIMISIFNYIIAPYIAEAFVSPNCFLYAISKPPQITSNYYDFRCYSYILYVTQEVFFANFECPNRIEVLNGNLIQGISFTPPFHYAYQCSSSLLSAFSYIFVYRYITTGLLEPWIVFCLKWFQISCLKTPTKSNIAWYYRVTRFLPLLVRYSLPSDISCDTVNIEKTVEDETATSSNKEKLDSRLRSIDSFSSSINSEDKSAQDSSIYNSCSQEDYQITTILSSLVGAENFIESSTRFGESVVVRLVTDIALLLSFGVLFPLLGIIVFFSLIKDIYFLRLFLGRLIYSVRSESRDDVKSVLSNIIIALNSEFSSFQTTFWRGIWLSCVISVLFWTFTIFDTLGSAFDLISTITFVVLLASSPYWIMSLISINYQTSFDYFIKCFQYGSPKRIIEMLSMNGSQFSQKQDIEQYGDNVVQNGIDKVDLTQTQNNPIFDQKSIEK